MKILFGKERSNHFKTMDVAGLLPPIYEDVVYGENDEVQQGYFETCSTTMLQAMTAKEKRQVSLHEEKNLKNYNGLRLLPVTEEESNDSEQNEGFEGNSSYDEIGADFSVENNVHSINLINRPDLEVIHEAAVFDDSVSHLRYFINEEGSSSGESPLQTAGIGNDPLLRHWVNLCTENIQQKKELDMELMGYGGNAGVTWEECANRRLQQLQKEQIRLEQEIQKESQFLSVVPGGYKLVQDLKDQLRNIYRESMPCYSDRSTVNDGGRMKEQVPEQKDQIPFEPKDLDQTVHANRLETRKEKTGNKNTSHQIVQEAFSLSDNNAVEMKTCHRRRRVHDDVKREATLKCGNKKILNESKPKSNVNTVTNGHVKLHLPPIMNSKQTSARSFSPQMSKSVCGLPDIHASKKMSINEETISSASESSQVPSRKASPLRSLNQKLPEIKSANRNSASPMTSQARTAKSGQIMPHILSPLVSIPKSSKEIRNFFQAPKRITMSKKLQVSNAHHYDILIIEHSKQERNLSANCVPQTKANGPLPPLKKVTSEPQRRCSEVKVLKSEESRLSKKSKREDNNSAGRRNGHH